eukprot:8669896-Alexandrium_andersonii.AAC.1
MAVASAVVLGDLPTFLCTNLLQCAESVGVSEESFHGARRTAAALGQLPPAMQTCPIGRTVDPATPS